MLVEEPTYWQLECGLLRQRGACLLASGQWADCDFLLGLDEVPQKAHKLLLAMASPVFQTMFYGPLAENDAPISIPNIRPEVFLQLLQYIYTDQINLDDYKIAIDLYYAAQKYRLRRLRRLCTAYLSHNLSPQNACFIYEFAYVIGDKKLECKSLKVIKAETKLALSDSSFENLSIATVVSIFSMDDITIDSELDLFSAAERYYLAHQKKPNKRLVSDTLIDIWMHSIIDQLNESISNGNDSGHKVEDKESAKSQENTLSSDTSLAGIDIENEDNEGNDRREATFRFTFQNFSNLREGEGLLSTPFYVRELPWTIEVSPTSDEGQKRLLVLLRFSGSKYASWTCEARARLKIYSHKPNTKHFTTELEKHWYCNEWGCGECIMAWDELLDPNKGYVKDGSITIQAYVTAGEPHGAPLSMKKLSEMLDLSIETIVKQIRFLTLTAVELAEYKPKSSLLTEHDIYALVMNITSEYTYVALPKKISRCRVARNSGKPNTPPLNKLKRRNRKIVY